ASMSSIDGREERRARDRAERLAGVSRWRGGDANIKVSLFERAMRFSLGVLAHEAWRSDRRPPPGLSTQFTAGGPPGVPRGSGGSGGVRWGGGGEGGWPSRGRGVEAWRADEPRGKG